MRSGISVLAGVLVAILAIAFLASAPPALGRELVPGPREFVEIGLSPHGMVEWGGVLLVQDWKTWELFTMNPKSGEVAVLCETEMMTADIALQGDILYLGLSEHRDALVGYDLSSSPVERVVLHFGDIGIPEPEPNREPHFGIEIVDNVLYMIIRRPEERRFELVEYNLAGGSPSRFYVLPLLEQQEPMGLQRRGDRFVTGVWGSGTLYQIEIQEDEARITPWLSLEMVLPHDVRSPGGYRGFYVGQDLLFLTTIACYEAGCGELGTGRVHVLPLPSWLRF